MVDLRNVNLTYTNYSGEVEALTDINLTIQDGEFVFIVGKSGAGKSTLIKLLMRELVPTSGRVFVNTCNLNKLKGKQIATFRRSIGVVFQDLRLIPDMTVYDNVAFAMRVVDESSRNIKKTVPEVLNQVDVLDKAKQYPRHLSGGEQQRVAIARALANKPSLIIADEPTGNNDPQLSYEITRLLKDINENGTTVIMVTHDHELVKHFGGRIINIEAGRITFDEVIGGKQ